MQPTNAMMFNLFAVDNGYTMFALIDHKMRYFYYIPAAPLSLTNNKISEMLDTMIQGDINVDDIINITDLLLILNLILGNQNLTSYQEWASDLSNDGLINITDILLTVNIIINN